MDAVKIGRRLQNLRGDRRREDIAPILGVSTSALAMYERGERVPRDEIKIRLSRFYGTSIEALFFAD